MSTPEKPGMFVSFESLLTELSNKLTNMEQSLGGKLDALRQLIDSKASKEHVDRVEADMKALVAGLASTVASQGKEIVDLRIGEGTSQGVSKTTLILGAAVLGVIGTVLGALIYVVATAHGGA